MGLSRALKRGGAKVGVMKIGPDFIDPAFAPGTGTPEIGGPNSFEAQKVIRELKGMNLIGADLVEVSPPFDPSGGTAYLGISLVFELMCILAEIIKKNPRK